ncbi:MAG TPA: histidine kinase dimerization/phospho-acceptor domain-containing protein [Rhodanobacteraceae bacterium]|nr:histidine kinase dimerization/phospho-acceptor domain-containing protein [Rhodanobacteraceae bacterium]
MAAELRDVRGAADALPDALVLLDHRDHVNWCNPAADHLLGLLWPRDQGVALTERFEGHRLATWLPEGVGEVEDVVSPIDAKLRLQLGLLAYGLHQRLLFARDISRLTRLEQIRRDFVANVSHELRTPLTVIHGYLELIDPDEAPAWAPVVVELRIQSQRMRQIVGDLLTLSRLEMQQHAPEERVEMKPLLNTLWKEGLALSQERHHVVLQNDADYDLLGSDKDLHSAFSNLLSNAVRYTTAGAHGRTREYPLIAPVS